MPTAKTAPLFVISESLGSNVVVDSLKEFESRHQTETFAKHHTVLGIDENPDTAHTCYLSNSPVAQAIAQGSGEFPTFTGAACGH